MITATGLATVFGHGPKVTSAGDTTPAIAGAGFEGTLYVIVVGTLADSLTYQLEDSENGSSWAAVSSTVVNGVAGQNALITCVQNSVHTMLVLNGAVRKFHRLQPAPGAGNNLGAVAAIKVGQDRGLSSGLTQVIGG